MSSLPNLPADLVDAHHHFFDPPNTSFQTFLGGLGAPAYMPEQYAEDCKGVDFAATVHVEGMPDDGEQEVKWVDTLDGRSGFKVGAIVAACNLSLPNVDVLLATIKAASPKVRGIRYILDYVGPFDGKTATHVSTTRHGKDYLRDSEAAPDFARGFALLAKHKLSFDLQCAPEQLQAAYSLFSNNPGVPVCICHMGKPRHLKGDEEKDAEALSVWRTNMASLASLPQVYVKISMLGYAVPGWHTDPVKESFLKALVLEVISLFGARRCMFASNFHINAPCSDSDGAVETGPSVAELYAKYNEWTSAMSESDRAFLFGGSAREFYHMTSSSLSSL